MARLVAGAVSFALLVLLAVSAGCDGGGEPSTTATSTAVETVESTAAGTASSTATTAVGAIDIKDFDSARFTMTQTSTTGGETSQITGEGVIDNRQTALSVTYVGGVSGQVIAIGRTIYSYDEGDQRWTSVEEPVDGQVGFGRPYWPQFWLDAVQIEELGGQSLQGAETSGYRLTFDLEKVRKRLQAPEAPEPLDVRQAEVEVWVDDGSHYAVQLTFRLELAFGGSSTKLEIVSNFSDFGTEVQIQAPEVASPTPSPAPR